MKLIPHRPTLMVPLRKIATYLMEHLRADYHPATYIGVTVFLLTTISINYWLDFEDSILDAYFGQEIQLLWHLLFYGFAYYSTSLLMALKPDNRYILQDKRFWLLSLAGLLILSLDKSFYYYRDLFKQSLHEVYLYAFSCLSNLRSLLTVFIPLALLYKFTSDQSSGFYGITRTKTDWRPYAYMLLIMVPLIVAASFGADFQADYPSYPNTSAHTYFGLPEWVTALFYELAYGWDFVATEWLFRGFFIIGMATVAGHRTVLPMVVTYAFLHFGKPLGETIGSIFGGYILGVIALRTGSIWGGIAIHLGIAWLMELAAFIQMAGK